MVTGTVDSDSDAPADPRLRLGLVSGTARPVPRTGGPGAWHWWQHSESSGVAKNKSSENNLANHHPRSNRWRVQVGHSSSCSTGPRPGPGPGPVTVGHRDESRCRLQAQRSGQHTVTVAEARRVSVVGFTWRGFELHCQSR